MFVLNTYRTRSKKWSAHGWSDTASATVHCSVFCPVAANFGQAWHYLTLCLGTSTLGEELVRILLFCTLPHAVHYSPMPCPLHSSHFSCPGLWFPQLRGSTMISLYCSYLHCSQERVPMQTDSENMGSLVVFISSLFSEFPIINRYYSYQNKRIIWIADCSK